MADIVERLRNRAIATMIIKDKADLFYDAIDEIERLRAENERLRKALKPFAQYATNPGETIYEPNGVRQTLVNQDVLIRICRAAKAALGETNG